MDQSVEAVLAVAIFFILLAVADTVSLGMFSSIGASGAADADGSAASLISSLIALQNNVSSTAWSNWSPVSNASSYGLSPNMHICINATAFHVSIDGDGICSTTQLWSKVSGTSARSASDSWRMISLDDGSVVLLVVVVWQ